jgi:chloride channel protein, CIC family
MNRNNSKMILVVNENDRLEGIVYKYKLYEFPEEYRKSVILESIMIKDPFFAYMSDSLHNALVRLSSNDLQEMPVLSDENNKVIGIITISDLVKLYDNEVNKIMKLRNRSNLSINLSDNAINNNEEPHPKDKNTN